MRERTDAKNTAYRFRKASKAAPACIRYAHGAGLAANDGITRRRPRARRLSFGRRGEAAEDVAAGDVGVYLARVGGGEAGQRGEGLVL